MNVFPSMAFYWLIINASLTTLYHAGYKKTVKEKQRSEKAYIHKK